MTSPPGNSRTECIRCGECCLGSSPSLHIDDVFRVLDGSIRRSDLYTLRAGEWVRDNIRGGLTRTEQELVKIRENRDTGACIFYDDSGKRCTIYEERPVQCAAMKCWDETEFMRIYSEPKANRRDLIEDGNLLRLMEAHEERCGYIRLDRYVQAIQESGEKAVEKILGVLKFDQDIRVLAPEKLGIDPDHLNLIFGRPLTETISIFGLKVIRQPDGSFFLTLMTSPPPLPNP